jgi:ankyrin repeat protein
MCLVCIHAMVRLLDLPHRFADDSKWTALHPASRNGHTEIVKLLIDVRADVNVLSTCPCYVPTSRPASPISENG